MEFIFQIRRRMIADLVGKVRPRDRERGALITVLPLVADKRRRAAKEAARFGPKPFAFFTGGRMGNLFLTLVIVGVSFLAGFQTRSMISQRRRRRQREFL